MSVSKEKAFLLGSNVPTIGGLSSGFSWAEKWGCRSIQIYVTPSRRWDVPQLSYTEVDQFSRRREASPVQEVVGHVPYLVNLASADKDLWQKSRNRLVTEIIRADELGASFLVLHPGSYGSSNKEDGIKRIAWGLKEVLEMTSGAKARILLETMAGQGSSIGSRFEELAIILNQVGGADRVGVCFDTAHVFISGYKLRGYEGYQEVLSQFDQTVGIERIKVIHLNDSSVEIGSRSDRHAGIGEGKMGLQVFHAFLRDGRFLGVPIILEVPERDEKSEANLKLLRELKETEGKVSEPRGLVYNERLF